MKTLPRLFAQVLALFAPFALAAQQPANAAREVFHKAWFISAQQASVVGVPISYERNNPNGFGTVPAKADGSGMAFGAGISGMFGDDRWLLQLAYDRASTKLSDWRVKDRPVTFSSVDITVGYATRGPITLVPFFSFAPGWYTQKEYKEFDFNSGGAGPDSSAYEALDKFDYNIALVLGIKAGFAKLFALTAESRWYSEDKGSACGATPNCIDVSDSPPSKKFGRRTAVGLQVYFGW